MNIMTKRISIGTACMLLGGASLALVFNAPVQANDKHGSGRDRHMIMTALRPLEAGDKQKADAIAADARRVAERYVDYKKALADGYEIFMPDQKQSIYHFVLESSDEEAKERFDSKRPAALLYERLVGKEPAYRLVGVMYTARFGASEGELNQRVPLSIARWHEHINLCVPSQAAGDWLLSSSQFGLRGSIATEAACTAAGGKFKPHLSGWMTHVYPFEKDPGKVWQAGMDHDQEDMMGMEM